MIAREVSNAFANKVGHRADSALILFTNDLTSESRADFVLSAMDAFERQKLLQAIPPVITENLGSTSWSDTEFRLARIHQKLKSNVDQVDVDRELASLRATLLTNAPISIAVRMALFSRELHRIDEQTRNALADFLLDAFQRADLQLLRVLSRGGNLDEFASFMESAARLNPLMKSVHQMMLFNQGANEILLSMVGELTSGLSLESSEELKAYVGTLSGSSFRQAATDRLQGQIGVPF
jgi:hypothetical protein